MASTPKPDMLSAADPDDHDFAAARDYLSLQNAPAIAESLEHALRETPTARTYKA